MKNIIPLFIGIACLIALLFLIALIHFVINKYRTMCNLLFNTDTLIDGIKKRNQKVENTPKSISAMTRIYLPQISKDFPEFHYNEMRERSESILKSYFLAIDKNKISLLTEGSIELKNQLEMYLNSNTSHSQVEHFKNCKIHDTEIYKYTKSKGKVIITFQSAVQFFHYFTASDGSIINGEKDIYKQALYNISVYYIQNSSMVESSMEQGLGLNCPNCGAPIHSLGLKYCAYCGTEIIEVNRFMWVFGEIAEDSKYS
jgi:hypothetical protein